MVGAESVSPVPGTADLCETLFCEGQHTVERQEEFWFKGKAQKQNLGLCSSEIPEAVDSSAAVKA